MVLSAFLGKALAGAATPPLLPDAGHRGQALLPRFVRFRPIPVFLCVQRRPLPSWQQAFVQHSPAIQY